VKQFILKSSNQRISLYDKAICRLNDGLLYSYIEDNKSLVKIYNYSQIELKHGKKLIAMIENRPPFASEFESNSIQLMWPTDMVFDEVGRYKGYIIDKLNLQDYIPLSHLLAPIGNSKKPAAYNYRQKMLVAYHFAALMSNLHQNTIHLININPSIILLNKKSLKPLLIASDELSILDKGRKRFSALSCNWLYCSPDELVLSKSPDRLGLAQDNYAIAVLIFQLLNQGLHPFQAMPKNSFKLPPKLLSLIKNQKFIYGYSSGSDFRPPAWSIHDFFDDETKTLFARAFSDSEERPSASEWQLHLKKYISENNTSLNECSAHPSHYQFFNGCGICAKQELGLTLRDRLFKSMSYLSSIKSGFTESRIKFY